MRKIVFALLFAVSFLANAAGLTVGQRTALAANITASSEFNAIPHTENGAYAIADAYNTPTSAFVVWKTSLNADEVMRNGIDWTRVDNLSVGKARIWEWMSRLGSFDCSKTNIRSGIDAAWVGTAADLAVRAYVYTQCKRLATRVEKLFATGTGTDATPALLVFEGAINYRDVADAMGW
jgi:hypothetical protein